MRAQICDELTRAEQPLCPKCLVSPQLAAAVLTARTSRLQRLHAHLVQARCFVDSRARFHRVHAVLFMA